MARIKPDANGLVEYIDPWLLKVDPAQPRQDADQIDLRAMASSIAETGVIQPLHVDPDNVIVCGELRLRAALLASWAGELTEVPIIRVPHLAPAERRLLQAYENLQRHDLNDADARDLLVNLREARRTGELPPPTELPAFLRKPIPGHQESPSGVAAPVPTSESKNSKPRSGRPPEPGSTRELATIIGWSQTKVATLLAGPEPAPVSDDEVQPEQLPKSGVKQHQKHSPDQALEIRMLNLARDLEKLGKVPTACWTAAAALRTTLWGLMHPDKQE